MSSDSVSASQNISSESFEALSSSRERRQRSRTDSGMNERERCLVVGIAQVFNQTRPLRHKKSSLRKNLVMEMKKTGATCFRGDGAGGPSAADTWLEDTMRLFSQANCQPKDQYMVMTSLLQDAANDWWVSVESRIPESQRTLDIFLEKFRANYVGKNYAEDPMRAFIELRQGDMTVLEYQHEFHRLFEYAKESVTNEARVADRFLRGLRTDLYAQLSLLDLRTVNDVVEKACIAEQVKKRIRDERSERQGSNKRSTGPNLWGGERRQ